MNSSTDSCYAGPVKVSRPLLVGIPASALWSVLLALSVAPAAASDVCIAGTACGNSLLALRTSVHKKTTVPLDEDDAEILAVGEEASDSHGRSSAHERRNGPRNDRKHHSRTSNQPMPNQHDRHHRRAGDIKSVSGNSFITLRSPVIKVKPPPVHAEEVVLQDKDITEVASNIAIVANSSISIDPLLVGGVRAWCLDTILHNSLGCSVVLLTSIMLVYAASKMVRSLRREHLSREVHAKVRRANEYFRGLHGDQNLCLCCVEFIIPGSSSDTVTFLCGHGFHASCVKDWYKRHTLDSDATCIDGLGHCPICQGQGGLGSSKYQSSAEDLPVVNAHGISKPGGNSSDCARLFTLHGLCEKYPGILTKEDSECLAAQPTAVLPSEVQFGKERPRSLLSSFCG